MRIDAAGRQILQQTDGAFVPVGALGAAAPAHEE